METKEITESNKIIAEFMGFEYLNDSNHPEDNEEGWYNTSGMICYCKELEFHSSWDWLMPVVDKICDYEVVGDFHVCGSTVLIISAIECDDNPISGIEIWHSGGDDKKRAVFEACVKFIKQIK